MSTYHEDQLVSLIKQHSDAQVDIEIVQYIAGVIEFAETPDDLEDLHSTCQTMLADFIGEDASQKVIAAVAEKLALSKDSVVDSSSMVLSGPIIMKGEYIMYDSLCV